jgi:hypothetical protein
MSRPDFGVLYFFDQNPFYEEMYRASVESLRRFHPDWPVEVVQCPSFPIEPWRKVYRSLSFWKRQRRLNRAHQDVRVISKKADVMLDTPFENTLYLDVDTIVMRPLDEYRERAKDSDIMITALPWKQYEGTEPWQPKKFNYLCAGVTFYNQRFVEVYRPYVDKLRAKMNDLPTCDQYAVCLACHMEAARLKIRFEPHLQVDTMNYAQHFGTPDYPRFGEALDLRWEGLKPFHVFHYNEYKIQHMEQIKSVWGFPSKNGRTQEAAASHR